MISTLWANSGIKLAATLGILAVVGGGYFGIQSLTAASAHPLEPHVLDTAIPFLPAASWIYQSLYLLLTLAGWYAADRRAVWRFAATMLTTAAVAFAIFLIWPTQVPPRPDPTGHGLMYAFTVGLDAQGNALPSLHVAFALVAAHALRKQVRRMWVHVAVWAWAGLIVLSTLVVKQHLLIDVLAGAILALVVLGVVVMVERVQHRAPRQTTCSPDTGL